MALTKRRGERLPRRNLVARSGGCKPAIEEELARRPPEASLLAWKRLSSPLCGQPCASLPTGHSSSLHRLLTGPVSKYSHVRSHQGEDLNMRTVGTQFDRHRRWERRSLCPGAVPDGGAVPIHPLTKLALAPAQTSLLRPLHSPERQQARPGAGRRTTPSDSGGRGPPTSVCRGSVSRGVRTSLEAARALPAHRHDPPWPTGLSPSESRTPLGDSERPARPGRSVGAE